MAGILNKVETIVLLMFENRSFDHILGHLSLEDQTKEVDGLREPLSNYASIYKGDKYFSFHLETDAQLPNDPPHEYNEVDVQLARSQVTQRFMMNGFVQSFAEHFKVVPNPQCLPMGFFAARPGTDQQFFSQNLLYLRPMVYADTNQYATQ